MFSQFLGAGDPSTIGEALIMAGGLIILAVAKEIGDCIIRHLHRIESKLDRNTRETMRAARAAEKVAAAQPQDGEH
jgi:hypothetical protein